MIYVDALHLTIDYWCKPTLVLGLVYVFMMRPSFRSAASNHLILVLTLLATVTSLAVVSFLPQWHWQILPKAFASLSSISVPIISVKTESYIFWAIIGVYGLGVSWVACHTLLGVKEALKLTIESRALMSADLLLMRDHLTTLFQNKKTPQIRLSTKLQSPMVWRWLRPTIVMPESCLTWGSDRFQRVLAHEYAHIERNDWLVKIVVRVICAVFWFVPPVWLISHKIDWYAEVACDDHVLNLLDCRAEYADDLLELSAEIKHSAFVLAYLHRSQLFSRIKLVLDPSREKGTPGHAFKILVVLSVLMVLIPIAGTRVHAHATEQSLFDIANYPLPTLVPLLAVPEEKYWADKRSRLQWIIDQQELLNERNKRSLLEKQAKSSPSSALLKQGGNVVLPTGQRGEESLKVVMPERRAWLKHTNKIAVEETAEVSLPDVAIRGYLPLKMVIPEYPATALRRKITGRVIVQFDVNEMGHVENARIVMAQPKKIFERSVLKAVEEFRFIPLTVDGEPIITKNVTETFVFSL